VTTPLVRLGWRYTFCDLLTRTPLARLPVLDAELGETIGGPANGSGRVPLVAPEVRAADPWGATQQRRTLMVAQRVLTVGDRETASPVLWAGIVWKRERANRSLQLTLATVESYWGRRITPADRTFAAADDALIQRTILADAEATPYGGLGVTLGAASVGTVSDRTVIAADLKYVLETMQSVATAAPFEWRITPGIDLTTGAFTLTLTQARLLGGAPTGALAWVSQPGQRATNEVLGYSLAEDGANVPNSVTGLGGAPGGGAPLRSVVTSADLGRDELLDGYPLLESTLGSSTTDLLTQNSLDRHTRQELAAMRDGEVQITGLTVRGDLGWTTERYGLGDTVTLRLADDLHPYPLELSGRIAARTIRPAQPGRAESVAMTLVGVS
jgi:hypothetical protein